MILKDGNLKVLDDLTFPELAAVKTVKFLFLLQQMKELFFTIYKVALADQSCRRQPHFCLTALCSCCYQEDFWILCVIAHFLVRCTKVLCGNSEETSLCHCTMGGLTADVARDTTNTVAEAVSQPP